VPQSHCLAFYFTSLAAAKQICKDERIPAFAVPSIAAADDVAARAYAAAAAPAFHAGSHANADGGYPLRLGGGGVVVSLRGPQVLGEGHAALRAMDAVVGLGTFVAGGGDEGGSSCGDESCGVSGGSGGGGGGGGGHRGSNNGSDAVKGSSGLASSREVVFCLRLPRAVLFPLPANALERALGSTGSDEESSDAAASASEALEDLRVLPAALLHSLGAYQKPELKTSSAPPPAAASAASGAGGAEAKEKGGASKGGNPLRDLGGDLEAGVAAVAGLVDAQAQTAGLGDGGDPLFLPSGCVVRAYQLKDDRNCVRCSTSLFKLQQ